MSFFKSAVILALVAAVSAQTSAPFKNATSTTTSAASTSTTANTAISTLTVNGKTWKYDGCASNSQNFIGFDLFESSPMMSIEKCLADCTAYQFAGISGQGCYCSNRSDNATSIKSDSLCNTPCGGNPKESCGGLATSASRRRAVPAGILLSLYETVIVSVIPASVYTTIIATEYVSVCPTGLTTVAYTATLTLTHCGCTNVTPVATIPLTTTVASCGCGPNGAQQTYTITVPAVVAVKTTTASVGPAGSATATATTARYTGAGNSMKAGSFLGAVGAVAAFVL